MAFLANFAAFAAHLAVALTLTLAFLAAYIYLTEHDELGLVRAGNQAAAIALAGALIGFAIVLSRAISVSQSVWDTLGWGLVALVVQIGGHYAMKWLLPSLTSDIDRNMPATAILSAAVAIALGQINAACLTP